MPNTKITTTTGDEVKIDMDEENTDTEEIEGGVEQKKSVAVAAACIISTTVSVAMIILNKAIVLSIPFGGGLVLLQNTATIIIIQSYRHCSIPIDMGWKTLLDNTPCAILFGINTFTSMQSLTFLSITTFTIFRNAQSILSYPLDYFIRGERLKYISIYFLFTIILGTYAYCGKDLRTNIEGIAWAAAHLVSTSLYAILTKVRLDSVENKVKIRKLTQVRVVVVVEYTRFFLSKNHFIKEHILSNNFFFLVVASIKAERERDPKKIDDGLIIIIISRCWI